jgi:voltage-gated potassium channel Kch
MLNEKWIKPRFGTRERDSREADTVEGECPVIIAGFGRFGHIVGRMLRANGVGCTVLDVDSDQVDILRKFGIKVFYGDASRFDLLRAAGAEHAKVLVLAIDQEEKRLEIVRTVRKHFPHLTILARARGRADAYEQLDAGVEHVYRETLDSSLRMAIDALRLLGVRGYQAHRAARIFRVHDERSVRELARMRHDEQAYIRRAREVIADLERVIVEDARELPHAQDAAWDTASLRRELGGGNVEPGAGEEGA